MRILNTIKDFFLRNLDTFAFIVILESFGYSPFDSIGNFLGFLGYGILRGLSLNFMVLQELQKLKNRKEEENSNF